MFEPFKRYSVFFLAEEGDGDTVAREWERERKRERIAGGSSTVREGGGKLARMVVIAFGSTSGSSWRG